MEKEEKEQEKKREKEQGEVKEEEISKEKDKGRLKEKFVSNKEKEGVKEEKKEVKASKEKLSEKIINNKEKQNQETFNDEKKSPDTKEEIKNEKLIKKIFIVLVIIAIALLVFVLIKDFLNVGEITFEYHNLTFKKTRFGEGGLIQYKTNINFKSGNETINHEITIRNHPGELEKIPANISGNVLKNTYVSFQKKLTLDCPGDVQLAGFRLGYDLFGALKKLLPDINVDSGLFDLDENATEKEKKKLKNCLDASDQTMVFLFEEGKENRIYPDEEYENCYHAEVKECDDVLAVSERLLLVILDKLRGYEE